MDDVDLDINNYNLEDLLQLFNLPLDFNKQQLKNAKSIVLKLHPDKSGLNSKYFIFYSNAYKNVCKIWEFKSKTEKDVNNESTVYVNNDDETSSNKIILNKMFEKNNDLKKPENFNKWFNDHFEKMKVTSDNDEGYGDWLKSDDGLEDNNCKSVSQMHEVFSQKRKQACNDIVEHSSMQSFQFGSGSGMGSDLINDSGGFDGEGGSGLVYQDLRKAYTETIVPVDDSLMDKRVKVGSVDELNRYRQSQDLYVPDAEQQRIYNEQKQTEDEMATRRAFKLAEHSKMAQQNSEGFWSGLKLLYDK
jgi:hypothetical protein|uniref:J domain-containing protein n=1 Tax=viral metagenome TaxID=1070528 RepID=A0A6C0INN4_9ZZZZ